mgnify:FL=1
MAYIFETGESVMMIRLATLTLVLAASLSVSACGRKGPLEPPNAKAPEAATETSSDPVAATPLPKAAKPKTQPKTDTSSPFLLDPLL